MAQTKNTHRVDNFLHTKQFFLSFLIPLVVSLGGWWATLVTSDLVIRSLSFISMGLVILVQLVKLYDRFRNNKKIEN